MQNGIAIIETGRPLKNARGGGSINSMLVLTRYYCSLGKNVHLIFRHYTAIDTNQIPKGVKVDYLTGPNKKDSAARSVKLIKKSYLGRNLKAFLSTFLRLKETYTLFQLLKRDNNLSAIHLNNRLLSNTHLIWLKLLFDVKLYQHQRQYDTYLPYPRWIYNLLIDNVICVSEDIQKSTQTLGIKKTKLLYNSCVQHQGEATYDSDIIHYKFIWIGRIVQWKGLHEIATLLEGINGKIHIYGVFDESSNYATESFELLNENTIDYEYHGYVPSNELFSQNYRNTFLLHSSIKPEPFGRVIIEAMSIGLIPISFGLGGSGELIDDEINGIVIKPQTPLLTYIAKAQPQWSEMGVKAKQKFKDTYCNEIHCAHLKELLCAEY